MAIASRYDPQIECGAGPPRDVLQYEAEVCGWLLSLGRSYRFQAPIGWNNTVNLNAVQSLLEHRLRLGKAMLKATPPPRNPFTGERLSPSEIKKAIGRYYPRGASESQIEAFETSHGNLRPDLHAWISFSNGPAGFVGIEKDEETDDLAWLKANLQHLFNDELTPVGSDIFGNYYVLGPDGFVHYLDAMNPTDPYVVASTLLRFVEYHLEQDIAQMQKKTHGWPTDREFFAERDPAVVTSGHRLASRPHHS